MARTDRPQEGVGGGGIAARLTSRAAAKAETRALKAANKPVSKRNRDVGGPEMRQVIINTKPANPNAVRGGSMKSQVNWPASMKSANHQSRIGGHAN